MIGYLTGRLLSKKAPLLLLDVQGVGYEINAPMTTFYHLPNVGESVALYTHLVVRDDAWNLFGFRHVAHRDLFRVLIKVNGIGPKAALSLLSGMEPAQLLYAIANDRVTDLTQIPGIGKKTAERLILETKTALGQWDLGQNASTAEQCSQHDDAISALAALGYKAADAKKALSKLPTDIQSTEDMIRHALNQMVKGTTHA